MLESRKINDYVPPPMGLSTVIDFNPTCHLKIAEQRETDENGDQIVDYD